MEQDLALPVEPLVLRKIVLKLGVVPGGAIYSPEGLGSLRLPGTENTGVSLPFVASPAPSHVYRLSFLKAPSPLSYHCPPSFFGVSDLDLPLACLWDLKQNPFFRGVSVSAPATWSPACSL